MDERALKTWSSALAGLLHGLNNQLGEDFITPYIPDHLRQPVEVSGQPYSLDQIADWWLAGQPVGKGKDHRTLIPILTRAELASPVPPSAWRYPLAPLQIETEVVYPVSETDLPPDALAALLKQMADELRTWQSSLGKAWDKQDLPTYLVTMLAVLRKYLWCIPVSTTTPAADIPLYEHQRLVSAVAACLSFDDRKSLPRQDEAAVLLVRGDLSGIQSFIYRITRPEAETEHVAKRLRGRSFYLSLLVEVAVDWMLREIGLPPNNALFVGGGRFDLLLPLSATEQVGKLHQAIEEWLLQQFHGELGLQIATCEARPSDFADMRPVYQVLDARLEESKRQKWRTHLADPEFYGPGQKLWHVCRVCQLTPLAQAGTCDLCKQHALIGKHLPYAHSLVYYYSGQQDKLPNEQVVDFSDSPFKVQVGLLRTDDAIAAVLSSGSIGLVSSLNLTADFIHPGLPSTFRFLANTAPRARKTLRFGSAQPLEEGDVLHFEALAELSQGAKRLGVLKADVDHLGLIMSEGLFEQNSGLRPTIARVAALSSALDLFFAGQLNQVCQRVSAEICQSPATHLHADDVDGLFYIMYSGGDDLFIVGPWDATLELAARLRDEFARFTSGNPNLTISAGFIQVKPRYPTQKFAELVDEHEKAAKQGGRNRIAAFGEVMEWEGGANSFAALCSLADDLQTEIESQRIPRGLIPDLGQVHRQHDQGKRQPLYPMWTPRLYYTLARRLSKDAFDQFGNRLMQAMSGGKILVPISIVSLITRKE